MPSQQTLSRSDEDVGALPGSGQVEPAAVSRRTFVRFFLCLFILPICIYAVAIPLVRLPGYERMGVSKWGPYLDFAFNTQGENADVVLFGDSSAFLGIDPRLLQKQLNIKAVVLPNTVGSLPVTGDQTLELYLAHNTRPRLIVLYFTAWDLDYGSSRDTRLYEGEEMLLRHGTPRQIYDFALKHPLELPAFPLRNYSAIGSAVWKDNTKQRSGGVDPERRTAEALGHVDDHDASALASNCKLPARFVAATHSASARALVAKYTARGYRVAVYLAPMPDCSNASAFANQTYDGLALAPAATLPANLFIADGNFAHLKPVEVPEATRIFGNTVALLIEK